MEKSGQRFSSGDRILGIVGMEECEGLKAALNMVTKTTMLQIYSGIVVCYMYNHC
jgi:hypothetical protein